MDFGEGVAKYHIYKYVAPLNLLSYSQTPSFKFKFLYFAFKSCVGHTFILGRLWTDLAETGWTFQHTRGQKSIQVSAKSLHRWQIKGVSDTKYGNLNLKDKVWLSHCFRMQVFFQHKVK